MLLPLLFALTQTVCAAAPVYSRADSLIAEANRQNGPRRTVVRGLAQRLKTACPAVVPVPPDTQPSPPVPPDPVALPTPTTIAPGLLTAPGPQLPTLTPTFSWSAVSGATGYVLAVRDVAANVIVYPSASGVGPPIPATALTLPAGVLKAATAYAWDVTAVNATSKSLASSNRYFQTAAPVDTTTPPPIPPDTSKFAGPAELPRVYLSFPYPTPTRSVAVPAGSNLQTALNSAQRGDELVLAAGASFTGNFTISSCGAGWITVRSAGVTNVVGTRARPSTSGTYAKVITPSTAAAITTTGAACRWRFVGLDVTVVSTLTAQQYGIMELAGSEIVLDRMYVHGQTTTNTSRCVSLNAASSQIADSWLGECHGKDFDSQAIFGYNGPGPYRIVNNYLAGAGENLMFGGATPTVTGLVPSDIEIRRNHFETPVAWKGVWQKKQLLELKNAARVLIEGNVLEGSWTDGQEGIAIGIRDDGCTWCFSRDITVRRNLIRESGAGVASASPIRPGVTRIFIGENVIDTLNVGAYTGNGRAFAQFGATFVTMERNLASGGNLSAGFWAEGGVPCVARSNVLAGGNYGMIASGLGSGTPAWNGFCGKNAASVYASMTFVGNSFGNPYPAGTTWLTSESQAPLAAQIRSIVQTATAGVVVPP